MSSYKKEDCTVRNRVCDCFNLSLVISRTQRVTGETVIPIDEEEAIGGWMSLLLLRGLN